ncbi:Chorismate synthase [Alteracholeplasma palmae J233]|uniref:Chorismate synthase n=1 Tax=Alteracholeplasma palmae (strain ATCC 49389 / J233) TaxID=1318466 RepID=U4KQL4_ALTPJ|nr:chorismate synthase [Alteracholeplasma palmae]CCV64785.1 Chorismate synthase [Alteracholeplasma palmae J233]
MNSFGNLFKITLYGESHQDAIGIVIDGLPSGIKVNYDLVYEDLEKRKPKAIGTTPRKEKDEVIFTSGIFNDYTTGSPVHAMIKNENTKSGDYTHLVKQPRPGHADYVASIKYKGFQDYRGGGRFSGRLTAPIVVAGSFAKMVTPFHYSHELIQIGSLKDMTKIDEYLLEIAKNKDSVGGIIEVRVKGLPIGIGEPMFSKVESEIGKMLFSIPAVKGVSFGTGFEGVEMLGSEFNDVILDETGKTKTNHSGGISGGITNGNDLVIKVFVKPTSSIQKTQNSFNTEEKATTEFTVGGRHDIAIVRRVGIVLENAVAICLADLYLIHKAYL